MLKHRLRLLAPVSSMVQSMAVGEPSSSSGMIVSTETEYRGPLLTVILDTASGAGLPRNKHRRISWMDWKLIGINVNVILEHNLVVTL